jgi:hypothetical protein
MATRNQTATPPQDPTEGGSHVRGTDGSLTTVQQTQPAQGRTQASIDERERRIREANAAAPAPAAPSATVTGTKE